VDIGSAASTRCPGSPRDLDAPVGPAGEIPDPRLPPRPGTIKTTAVTVTHPTGQTARKDPPPCRRNPANSAARQCRQPIDTILLL
jgi:hypothetical protein